MSTAQGINAIKSFKKQTALGSAASGSGGTGLRRVTGMLNLEKDTYSNNEIVSHQQHTGDIHGIAKTSGTISGVLSAGTYSLLQAGLMRDDFTATTAITGMSITIAGSNPYTITRAAGDFLTGGIKIGDIGRLSAGAFNANNLLKNILVTGVTATVITGIPVVSGSTLTAEGPIASSTFTVIGKKSVVPTSGHTNDYFTFEEWWPDLAATKSHTFPDVQVASIDVSVPATGLVTTNIALVGLGTRTEGGSQVLTSPSTSTSTAVSSVAGAVLIGGTRYAVITSASIKIEGNVTGGEAVIGSNTLPDVQRGRIKVSGSFTALFDSTTLSTPFTAESATSMVLVLADSRLDTAEFITFSMSAVKLFSDSHDDGEKQIVRTFNFVAQYNGSGGAALANDATILTIQDSLAA